MNDISVKEVEPIRAAEPAAADANHEADPLAIDDVVATKEAPVVKEAPDCDDNAKEESTGNNEEKQSLEAQTDDKEIPPVTEESVEDTTTLDTTIPESAEPTELNQSSVADAVVQGEEAEPIESTSRSEPTVIAEDAPTPDLVSPAGVETESELLEEALLESAESAIVETIEIPESAPETPAPIIEDKQPSLEAVPEKAPYPEKEPIIAKVSTPEPEKVPTPEARVEDSDKTPVEEKSVDVEMAELPAPVSVPTLPVQIPVVEEKKVVEKVKAVKETISVVKPEKIIKPIQPVNGDVTKEDQPNKRRASEEIDIDTPLKKLCQEIEKTFPGHDSMISDYIQTTTKNNIDEIQRHTEQLLAEIQTLRELAQKKEYEWNNILHLKKVKEEILLRLLRRKQVLLFEKSSDLNGSDKSTDPFDYLNQAKNLAIDKSDEISGLAIKQPGSAVSPMMQTPMMPVTSLQSHYNPMAGLPPPYDKAPQAHMNMPKPVFPQPMMMPGPMPGFPRDMNGQLPGNFNMPMGRQGPTKDVKSIIADYRQRNPDVTPRRGRRMKSILNPNMMNAPRPIAPKVDGLNNLNSMNNLSNLSNLNMLFNNLDMNQKAMLERLQQIQAGGLPNSIFKDALVQFANMQQASSGLIPNRPPETVTTRPEHHPKERRRERERNHEEAAGGAAGHKQPERVASSSPRLASSSPRLAPPPPYPEISLLPVTTADNPHATHNSLLHGILTKRPAHQVTQYQYKLSYTTTQYPYKAPPQSYSPTLAKLLTSPERKAAALPAYGQAKNCGEITITPVQPTPQPEPQPEKPEEVVQLDDEESPASESEAAGSPHTGAGAGAGAGATGSGSGSGGGGGRLVIDESAEDTPLCQGCRRRAAQFVCAGCANQWYCSRDCQVAAWDDHSDMCSG